MDTPLPYVNFGPHGRFTPSGNFKTTSADIDALTAYLRQQKTARLAIHFHGGLIAEKAGIAIANKMVPVYSGAGCLPLSIVWETGLIETFRYNIKSIHETELFQKLLIWVLKKAAGRMGIDVDSKGAGQEMSTAEIKMHLASPSPFEKMAVGEGARGGGGPVNDGNLSAVENEIAAELEVEMDADPEFAALIELPGHPPALAAAMAAPAPGGKSVFAAVKAAWSLAKIVTRVIKRFISKHDHDFYPTVIEELLRAYYIADLGEWVWTKMKDSGENMWKDNTGIVGDDRYAGRYLVEALASVQKDTDLVIDLVGHSAGSIAICRLLSAATAGHVPIKFRTIALLAPAVRSDIFLAEIARRPDRFERLRVFTMSDAFETQDHLAGKFYTRSLLYFISGVLEGDCDVPIVGMERYLSGAKPYDSPELVEVRDFLHEKPERLVLSKTAAAASRGFRSQSASHGDFDDDAETRESLTYLLSH